MRIRIEFDSATTKQVRDLSVALNKVNLESRNRLTVGVEGPECWGGITPSLTPNQFATVFAHLVKCNGDSVAAALDAAMAAS